MPGSGFRHGAVLSRRRHLSLLVLKQVAVDVLRTIDIL